MILLNMERSAKLFDVELPLTQLSDVELKPESSSKVEESIAFLSKPLEENPRGLGRKYRDGDLVEEAGGTGLTPRIDFRMELDSSKVQAAEDRLGLRGVDVDWVVVLMAILALSILGISGFRGVGFSFILPL
jgi:hypothetical protein